MKLQKLSLIISFMLFSISNIFAQNNDMKARMEYEDAETAYQSQDYQKAITHLESAEKLLGKPMAKTRYLLILALSKNLTQDYEYQDLEKLKKLSKHYVDNYTTDTEKYRDIYDLSKNLDKNYPKSLNEYQQLQIQKNERKKDEIAEIEIKRNNFLNYKTVSFYEDGKYIKNFKDYKFSSNYSLKDKKVDRKYYVMNFSGTNSIDDSIVDFYFNENKLSYSHSKARIYYPTTSKLEELKKTFLKDTEDFAYKYNLTPEIINNPNGEIFTYKFSYKNKTVEFISNTSNIKGMISYTNAIIVTNHNYENK